MKLPKVVAACVVACLVTCLVVSGAACDSVDPGQIGACAKACALSGQRMRRVTDKECACDAGDGGAP